MTTLVLCVDREGRLDRDAPVVGEERIRSLVTEVGIEDPASSRVNSYLETLRVARDLRADDEDAVVAVLASDGDGVGVDRAMARQVDALVATYAPDAAVIVVDSAEDERVVPIIESRVRVDAVDRVIVRQARDIESTYYLLKQFLADEELRSTVLVPLGVALLALPVLLTVSDSFVITAAVVAASIGLFFLYKGLGIDDVLAGLPSDLQRAFYSGQVSLVTYVVGVGLALVGLFAGAITVTEPAIQDVSLFLRGMLFVFEGVPWFALAALAASTGRLVDEMLDSERVRASYMNLPFGVVAVGFVVRGFAAFFLENGGVIGPLSIPAMSVGPVSIDGLTLTTGWRLAVFIALGVAISLVGVRLASYMSDLTVEEEVLSTE